MSLKNVRLDSFCNLILRRYNHNFISSKHVRERFIDYFMKKDHSYVRSSSVMPYNDPTLEFVNAGMNQFKNVFLDVIPPAILRATNSQKCIRIGGKHNDLNAVGYDTYHHTFFEMLGNWSFGDYFKRESCEMAFELITSSPYSLDPDRLYVTYFGGDEKSGLSPDLETKEIWEKIGFPSERIIPFGLKDNFWEMGNSGPCGPCTEIHYDHRGKASRPGLVNKDLPDLTELWNIVFIQFERQEDGTLDHLKRNFVDTGMGLERLVALLQNKKSNYDTDLFKPLFEKISEVSGVRNYRGKFGADDVDGIDTSYRILADHARMICVAISDNVLPEHSHGLRRVIRKALLVAEKLMREESVTLLIKVIRRVAKTLDCAYPELSKNMNQVELVLKDESLLWNALRESVRNEWKRLLILDPLLIKLTDSQSPGLITACKELNTYALSFGDQLPPRLGITLYDRHGLNIQLIEELCALKGLKIDMEELKSGIKSLKDMNKASLFSTAAIKITHQQLNGIEKNYYPTDDSDKFKYTKTDSGEYAHRELSANVLEVFLEGQLLETGSEIKWGKNVGVLLDRTNFWTSSKGTGDVGNIVLRDTEDKEAIVEVVKTLNYSGYILHFGKISPLQKSSEPLTVGNLKALARINEERRLSLMRNTTASHILSHVLSERLINNVQSYKNLADYFEIKYSIYGQTIDEKDILEIEKKVNDIINDGLDIKLSDVTVQDLLSSNEIYLPPYINAQHGQMQLLNFFTKSNTEVREITLGPNVTNTKDVGEFCIVNYDKSGRSRECTFRAVSGINVARVKNNVNRMQKWVQRISKLEAPEVENEVTKLKNILSTEMIPLKIQILINEKLDEIVRNAKERYRLKKEAEIETVVNEAKEKGLNYIVHYVGENTKLEKLTRLCPELPIILFAYNRGHLTARCVVPKDCSLSAEAWVNEISKAIGTSSTHLKGHNPKELCIMKPVKLPQKRMEKVLEKAQMIANTVFDSFR